MLFRSARTCFAGDASGTAEVDAAAGPLGEVVRQEADTVRIDAAQVGGDEGVGHQVAGGRGCAGGGSELAAKGA